jgi:uncharacterized membrane protein YfhO
MYSALKQEALNLRTVAVVQGPVTPSIARLEAGSSDHLPAPPVPAYTRNGPNQFSVRAEVKQPGMLMISETWYPGWHALVNGRQERIWQADGSLMGIYLTPGLNNIVCYFRPDYFYLELVLTVIALAVLAGSAVMVYARPSAV